MRRSVVFTAVVAAIALAPAGVASAAVSSPCPGDKGDPTTSGWALSTTTFDNAYTRHAYVGNGYLSQRVPATGTGYVETTQKTGWPLFTPAYDGAFVAGLYSKEPDPLIPPHDATIAAIPTWSTLSVTAGADTYSTAPPASQISNFRQTLFLRCGVLRTTLTWTPRAGRATDLAYDVIAARNSPHVGAVRLTVTPRWSGDATVTDVIDGAGARRVTQTGGGAVDGTVDVALPTLTTAHDRAAPPPPPRPLPHPDARARGRGRVDPHHSRHADQHDGDKEGSRPDCEPGADVRRRERALVHVHEVRRRRHGPDHGQAGVGRDRGLAGGGERRMDEALRGSRVRVGRP